MYLFLILYILLIIPVLNIKFDKKTIVVASLIFVLFIIFLRDPSASSDFVNYMDAVEGKNIVLKSKSPAFGLFIDLFKDVFGFNSKITYQIICLIPFICIFLSALILNSYLIIPIYLSSETFVLLSFNGIRQGLAIGFLSLSVAIFIKEIIESKNNKISSYIMVISFSLLSFLSHDSSIIIFSFLILFLLIKRSIKILLSLKFDQKTLLFLVFGLFFTSLFIFFQGNVTNLVASRILSSSNIIDINNLLQTGSGYGASHLNSTYRFTIMYFIYFYTLKTLKKFGINEDKNKDIKYFLSSLNISFFPLIIILLFLPANTLSRFSHYYIIPIFGMLHLLNNDLHSKRTFIYKIITVIGLITYSSKAVISNLYSIPNYVN